VKQQIREFMSSTGILGALDYTDKTTLCCDLEDLVPLLQEELDEFQEAVNQRDVVETVDAVVDLMYFLQQAVIKLELAGVNIVECCNEVCLNNQLKYTTSYELAEGWLDGTPNRYVDENVAEDGVTYYCVKDLDTHKVKKYNNFPSPDLKQHIPEYLY